MTLNSPLPIDPAVLLTPANPQADPEGTLIAKAISTLATEIMKTASQAVCDASPTHLIPDERVIRWACDKDATPSGQRQFRQLPLYVLGTLPGNAHLHLDFFIYKHNTHALLSYERRGDHAITYRLLESELDNEEPTDFYGFISQALKDSGPLTTDAEDYLKDIFFMNAQDPLLSTGTP